MTRCLFKLFFGGVVVAGVLLYLWFGHGIHRTGRSAARPVVTDAKIYSTRTWSNPASLPDHFARHGRDFGARDSDDYARMAYEFFQRAQREGLPAKVDRAGVYRVFDPRSGTFGAYNPDGTTKTFFKPGSRGYFDRQPGQSVNLRKLK